MQIRAPMRAALPTAEQVGRKKADLCEVPYLIPAFGCIFGHRSATCTAWPCFVCHWHLAKLELITEFFKARDTANGTQNKREIYDKY